MGRIRSRRLRRLRSLLLVAVAAGAVALAVVGWATEALRSQELNTVDTRFSIRGDRKPPKDIVVVAVDAKTFDALGLQWPFPRSLHARVIDRLRRAGARAIGYDVQFTERTTVDQDNALVDAVDRAHGKVVLATTEVDSHGHTNIFGGDSLLREIGARPSDSLLPPDPGGVFRRVPYALQGLKSFAVALAEDASGRRIDRSELGGGNTAWIDYVGGPGRVPTVSLSDVSLGRTPPGLFRNKVVVIGASAPTLQDVHPTSTSGSGLMSGPEIQANAVETALRGFPLKDAPGWIDVVVLVLLAAMFPLLSLALSPLRALALTLVGAAVYAVAAQLAFDSGRVIPVVYPLGAFAVSVLGGLGVHYATAVAERMRLRDMFGRFVPESVVDQVVGRIDEDLRLGGEEATATVLFSDLRGFTTFSEALPASRVIEILNRYLSSMSEAIRDHGGTLCSFLGDGMMAVFGVPIEQPDHADRALAAAREMLGLRLEEFNRSLRAEGIERDFQMGVGLNTGKLMAGNVGAEWRCEYTIIGDTVNTASRLEGMTKGTPHSMFMAESTRGALSPQPADLIDVGELPVRGRSGTVRIWSVASTAKVPAQDEAEQPASLPGA